MQHIDHWDNGEPSDDISDHRHDKHQECLALKAASDVWTNEFCVHRLSFICEREFPVTSGANLLN
ncbi:hypothetical protein ACF0H5_011124 [Mactra antiquata]